MYQAREYYDRIVRPTVEEFSCDHHNPRRGMLACLALLHTVNHVYQNRTIDPKKASKAVTEFNDAKSNFGDESRPGAGSFDYAAVHAFANASKYARLTREKLNPGFGSKYYNVVRSDHVDDLECDASILGDEMGGVMLIWDQDRVINLREAIEHTMGVLEAEFSELTE